MAWELLPVDYTDAVWSGRKKYTEITNDDGTVSFDDVTQYSNREKSFFGAKEANRMDEALNTLMNMVENGTDLYEAFQNYFDTQKTNFESKSETELEAYKTHQQELFDTWFSSVKGQLSSDAAGSLQNEINNLSIWKMDGEMLIAPTST